MKLDKSDLQLETIVSRISAGELDLQPDFQRGEVWDVKRRRRLIDTILRGWYVPAVHLVLGDGGAELVLDGQQRLAAIRDFFGDKIRVDGASDPLDASIVALDNLVFSELPPEVQKSVRRFVLQVVSLSDYNPQEPNELFFRLNQSYNLTPPEKRNALYGPARNQVKQLVTELMDYGLLDKSTIGFSNGRLAYDDIVARSCVVMEFGTLRTHINNKVVEQFYREQSFSADSLGRVRNSAQVLLEQIRRSDYRIKFNKGTLQTWLVYCAWAPSATGAIPRDFLHEFESDRLQLRRDGAVDRPRSNPVVTEIVRIYDDRASYRVTDVSSVRARDLALQLYSESVYGTRSVSGSSSLLAQLSKCGPSEVQRRFFDFIETSGWGDPIVPS